MDLKFSIVIPTLNAGDAWIDCLQAIKSQSRLPNEILVIDSSSKDATVARAVDFGCRVISINSADFSHGKTRQNSLSYLTDVDYVVFLTQDAILSNKDSLLNIVKTFVDLNVGASYGKQLPRKQARELERYERLFNYPEQSSKKIFLDKSKYGVKTAFISNSFAAYRVKALQEVGGFPSDAIMAEDMYVAAKMLIDGWGIYYCADSTVYHSHDYSLKELFCRYFDTGVFHNRERWIQEKFGKAGGEGQKYAISEIQFLWRNKPLLIPYSILRNAVKFLGYRFGLFETHLPQGVKRFLSMHKNYWD